MTARKNNKRFTSFFKVSFLVWQCLDSISNAENRWDAILYPERFHRGTAFSVSQFTPVSAPDCGLRIADCGFLMIPDSVMITTVEPRLSELFLLSQFGHEYSLVTIKIRSHILLFCSQRVKAALALVAPNEEHSNEFWLSSVVAKWNFTLYGMENKEASVTNVYSRSSAQAIRSFHKR